MGRGKPFECELTVSRAVQGKLERKHAIEIWEIEEVIYDDPKAFSLKHRDFHFVYGRTGSGRYLLVLVRVLESEEIRNLGLDRSKHVLKVITARDMNQRQRHLYTTRKGDK